MIVALLQNLVDFLAEPGDLDPLIRMAVAHYQFEAIHPVRGRQRPHRAHPQHPGPGAGGPAGNPRALPQPVHHPEQAGVLPPAARASPRSGDWEGWLLYMLAAVEETARWTTGRIRAIRDLLEATTERCRRELPARVYSKELIELIFVQPYVQDPVRGGRRYRRAQTASEYLRELERDRRPGRRETRARGASTGIRRCWRC